MTLMRLAIVLVILLGTDPTTRTTNTAPCSPIAETASKIHDGGASPGTVGAFVAPCPDSCAVHCWRRAWNLETLATTHALPTVGSLKNQP